MKIQYDEPETTTVGFYRCANIVRQPLIQSTVGMFNMPKTYRSFIYNQFVRVFKKRFAHNKGYNGATSEVDYKYGQTTE